MPRGNKPWIPDEKKAYRIGYLHGYRNALNELKQNLYKKTERLGKVSKAIIREWEKPCSWD